MSTSGSANFNVTRDDIISAAYRGLHVIAEGDSPNSDQTTYAAEALNMIVKQWQGKADFAPGLKVWTRKRATLFLQKNQYEYSLGITGDHCTLSYNETTLSAAGSLSDTSITVASTSGISSADIIGITLDDDTVHWDVVNGAPGGSSITLTTGLAGAATSGNRVVAYTSKITRPLDVQFIAWRDSNGDDRALDPMTFQEYESIPDKNASGESSAYLYESTLPNGTLYLDTSPDDVDGVLRITYHRPIEDFDSSTDDADYPQQWFRALKFQLMIDLADEVGVVVTQSMKMNRDESMAIAQNSDPEEVVVYFESES